MHIGGADLADRILVVAEIGSNHEGSLDAARELVRAAAECGAGAVKFQTYRADRLVRPTDAQRLAQLSSFELPNRAFEKLRDVAHELGLLFLSTPFDLESVDLLEPLVDAFKVASGDNDFVPLLERIARTGKPVIVSSGLAELEDIRRAKELIEGIWQRDRIHQELAVLHCVSAYPLPPEGASLAAIPLLARELQCTVGYSDHTIGIEACVLAAALDARILEKHFTLDHAYSSFRDHQLSADPPELRELVRRVELAQTLLGRPEKVVRDEERETGRAARRSIVAAADLPRGHRLRLEDLTWLRPRDGLAPGEEHQLIERRLKRDVAFGEPILPADVE
jgi:sialic acid synthase SpsE